jgi:3-deoxy-7-phosphoheptulonate synthase
VYTENIKSTSAKTAPVIVDSVTIGGPDFVVIAGPCSIESENQFQITADHVKKHGASMLRGGVWKLRTSSDTFQGLGPDAFGFIDRVLKKTSMGLITEVTDPRQLEVLDSHVVMYQVGSRNMHNYALLKELGKTNKPVLLKRGFAAYVDEWIKAADYIVKGGNDRVILCERGIRTFETVTRNTMDLNSVVYLKEYTSFPVIVDPSHAVGVRKFVSPLALAATAAGADGVIVEVHPNPAEALSDGPQALTFDDFEILSKKIKAVLQSLDRKLHPFSPTYERNV